MITTRPYSRFSGLSWMTKRSLDMQDVHEHVKSVVMPDFAALTEEHKVPYLPAAAVGAVLGKLVGTGIGSVKRSPWTHELKWKPGWRDSSIGYTAGGIAGAGAGIAIAGLINKIRGEEKKKKRKVV